MSGWDEDACGHWSRRLPDGRYLAVWKSYSGDGWRWEELSADGESRVLASGSSPSRKLAMQTVEAYVSAGIAQVIERTER